MNSAAPARAASSLSPIFDRPHVAFFGRSLAEYRTCFTLDHLAWRGRSVLDVASGPSSFTAEARRAGVEAVAVDPAYADSPDHLAGRIEQDYDHMFRRLREPGNRSRLRWQRFRSLAAAEADRRAAAARFLRDFRLHRQQDRYVAAALPQLPFLDRAFDLVLCAHLLFLYPMQHDFAFYVAAGIELMRVAREEVRIHPVCGPDGGAYPELARLQAAWAQAGITSRAMPVTREFLRGTSSTLVLSREGRR